MSFRVEEITTTAGLEALRAEWSRLWEECPAATPFQAPEWLLPWWRRLGRGRLWSLALRREGRLVGLAPLCVQRYYGLPLRRAVFLRTGVTDYMDVLLHPSAAGEGVPALLRRLLGPRAPCDFCDLQQLPP